MTHPDSLNDRLAAWAQTHPTKASAEDVNVREAFVARFPLATLPQLTLEEYTLGRGDTENFSYWLEWKTGRLGSIRGGTSKKFGVYWNQKTQTYVFNSMFNSAEEAKTHILTAIRDGAERLQAGDIVGADLATARAGGNRYGVRLKPLALHFPELLLPISKPDDLKTLLRRFGQTPSGDQLALNVQLLAHLRQQPNAAPYDTLGLMRFLYDEYIYIPTDERHIWKVAPGADATYLDAALAHEAIFIGSRASDLGAIPASAMAAELTSLSDPQAPSSASAFAHTMGEGDIVIANRGRSRVVAVGVIVGPYTPPDSPLNPLPVGTLEPEWRHARRVKWVITSPLTLPSSLPMLAMRTVSTVQEATLQAILTAYHDQDGSPEMLARLQELGWTPPPPVEALPADVRYLVDLAEHTRNIVLYGPPGTGKTRLAREFARAWLRDQRPVSAAPESSAATWWQAVVLALADLEQATVPQILAHPAVQDFAARRPQNNSVRNTVSQQLVTHTHPDDAGRGAAGRLKPHVFTRVTASDGDDALWALTDAGRSEAQRLDAGDAALPAAPLQAVQHVTFHPAFTYEDFMEGLRPERGGGFAVRDGVFKRLCRLAHGHPEHDFVLIIDEINRADTAKTFGELITLLEDDKRSAPGSLGEHPITLPYSDAPDNLFSVPDNVYIIGTMNTADRSITLMDVALRRRFTFVEVPPRPELITGNEGGLALDALLTRLNGRLTADLDADHRIGHAYLMGEELGVKGVAFRWRHKVVPLLQEYYSGREKDLAGLLGETLYGDALRPQGLTDNALMQALRQWTEQP